MNDATHPAGEEPPEVGPPDEGPGDGRPSRGLIRRTWAALRRPSRHYTLGSLLTVGALGGVLFWGGFNWSLELTNTEAFCVSCHEMERNVWRELRDTVHYTNRTGVRATCPDCHVPNEWVYKVMRKIRASNELYHHVLGTIDTPEKFEAKRLVLAQNEWRRMKRTDSRECRNCHSFTSMDFTKQENRSSRRHEVAIKEGMTCIDCHKGIAHDLPEGTYEDQERVTGLDWRRMAAAERAAGTGGQEPSVR